MTDCQGTAIDGDHCRTGQRHTFRRGRPRLLPFIWCRDGARRIWLPMGQCWRTGDRCPRGPMGCRQPGPCPGASQDCDGEAVSLAERAVRCAAFSVPNVEALHRFFAGELVDWCGAPPGSCQPAILAA